MISVCCHRRARTVVFIVGTRAVKVFLEDREHNRLRRELEGNIRARSCSPWCESIIPQHQFKNFPMLIGPRGYPVDVSDSPKLEQWVVEITTFSECIGSECSLIDILHFNRLIPLIGQDAVDSIIELLCPSLSTITLPSGPQHGDLHRGNILWCDGHLKALDCDRFRIEGIPLFDRIHFLLSERMRVSGTRWLPLLLKSEDIVKKILRQSGRDASISSSVSIAYALDRIANEGQMAFLSGKKLDKYALQLNLLFGSGGYHHDRYIAQ